MRECDESGCERVHYARGLCKHHYRQQPDQNNHAKQYERDRRKNDPVRQESERKRLATPEAKARKKAWAVAHKNWGDWWTQIRYWEDKRDIKAWNSKKPKVWPHCKLKNRPQPRLFIACWCSVCETPFVSYAGRMHGSTRCSTCTKRHWRGNHERRARIFGATYETIAPKQVFASDGWRCQLCGVRVLKKKGDPRSATLDHITPLSRGGHHVRENVQTACARCNFKKGAGAANDQMRLRVA